MGITPLSPQTSKKPVNSSPDKSSEAASQDTIGEKKVDPFSVLNSIATDGAKDKVNKKYFNFSFLHVWFLKVGVGLRGGGGGYYL